MAALTDKTALITGASRGIGLAIAQRFAAEGAAVVLCASRMGAHGKLKGTLETAVANIQGAGGRAAAIACDLTDPDARASLVEQAAEFFGPLDIIVNNAAGSKMLLPSETTAEQRSWMFDINVNAPISFFDGKAPMQNI